MDTGTIIIGLTIFVLACFAGAELISKVPQTLHTPLMSASNAISGVAILGALLATGRPESVNAESMLGFFAVVFASVNLVGGYMVTNRMLQMFKKKKRKKKE